MLVNLNLDFVERDERASLEEIGGCMHPSGDSVRDRRYDVIGFSIRDALEQRGKRSLRHELYVAAQQCQSGLFAERAAFALKCDSRFVRR